MSLDASEDWRERFERAHDSRELSLTGLHLEELPAEVHQLRTLTRLSLVDCGLRRLPEWLGDLEALEVIDLGSNPLEILPESMGHLTRLRALGLSTTGLTEVPASLAGHPSLLALIAPGNHIAAVPSWIGTLERLEALDLGFNQLQHLPDEIARLRHLRILRLWGHAFDAVPEAIRGLDALELLDLSQGGENLTDDGNEDFRGSAFRGQRLMGSAYADNGKITSVPHWLADGLPSLRYLHLDGQRLTSLPRLPPRLTVLTLEDNNFAAIAPSICDLVALDTLLLAGNQVRELPDRIRTMSSLDVLDVTYNALRIPPEVLGQADARVIFDFLARVQGPTQRLNEAKLVVVGEGSVGKTSLIKRLVSGGFSPHETMTEGIEVTRWQTGDGSDQVALNIWDFGGQEIMHATHQFFLTRRSVYVLVLDARQSDEQNRVEYWLKLIQGFSDGSPVIIVANKTEQSPLDIDERGLRAKYANLVEIVSASCQTGVGIDQVEAALAQTVAGLAHVHDVLPTAFFDVKSELEAMDGNYLAYDRYQQLCEEHGVADQASQELLVGFLHDLGTVLCFRDDPRLSDTNILNPQWVTAGVYRILNSHLAAQRKGLLRWADINAILNDVDYPSERRSFIIDMMKRFELCYEADDMFLVPDLLTKQEPDTGDWSDALRFEVQHDVLPSSVISRLVVRMNHMISSGTVWRTGVVLAVDGNRALVKGDREDATIRIAVSGAKAGRRGLLTAIRTELRSIADTMPGMEGEERVPIPRQPGVWVPYGHLLNLEAAGHSEVVPNGMTDSLSIRSLLDGIEQRSAEGRDSVITVPRMQSPEPAVKIVPMAGSAPWTPAEGLRFGRFLVLALCLIAAVFVGAAVVAGQGAAVFLAAAVCALGLIAILVLRSGDRMSEQTFLEALKSLLRAPRERDDAPAEES
ncbi:COR domain-containing protein [Baekduia sp.]|jgi:small GTP-binding protein|uniref:COR domain-containing protein n=1 Tax=Baekduia sp. TaxID=2600305 RepID=UPI002E00A882|nr:COR domain-containing protein [Baekduia sp.]